LIDTYTEWPGDQYFGSFGEPNTATVGEEFYIYPGTTENYLEYISVYLDDRYDFGLVDNTDFGLYIGPYGGPVLGDFIYESERRETSNQNGFEEFTFWINQEIEPGNYVFFISASEYFDGRQNVARVATRNPSPGIDPYPDGKVVYNNNGNNTDAWRNSVWTGGLDNYDLAFKMQFSEPPSAGVIPEPSSLLLLAGGLLSLPFARRKR
jgi:hypothetical protein